jgi:D-arabinose 1-dehydrogenase-like Zn-dependent alcohol dehydrogenase
MSRPTMRAVRLDTATGEYALTDVPRVRPAAGEVLVRVAATAIGRVDLDVLQGRLVTGVPGRTQIVPGHEVAGFVAAPGAGVDGWPLNRRVAVHPVLAGHAGDQLLGLDHDGGWAAYVTAPAANLVLLPPAVGFEQAAVLTSAAATPWSALTGAAGPRPGESLGVWGVGGLGMHAVQVGRLIGAAPVVAVDPFAAARERALAAGADVVLDPGSETFGAQLRAEIPGGLDAALEASGEPAAAAQAVDALGRHGRLIMLGLTGTALVIDDRAALTGARRQVVGHFGSSVRDLARLVRLVELGRLDLSASVASVHSLEDATHAIAAAGTGSTARVVLTPEAAPPRY